MDKAIQTKGSSVMKDVEKVATLALIDDAWKEHLRNVDDLKESVQSASFEQKDPLVIYKMEAYNLFESLIGHINSNVTSFLLKGTLDLPDENSVRLNQEAEARRVAQIRAQQNRLRTNASAANGNDQPMTEQQAANRQAAQQVNQQPVQRIQPIIKEKVVGRNEPCPCGSGKKYKNCHG
jgi:preprotein translocase subunit SecA